MHLDPVAILAEQSFFDLTQFHTVGFSFYLPRPTAVIRPKGRKNKDLPKAITRVLLILFADIL